MFAEGTIPAAFKVTESTVTSKGVILVNYERARAVPTGVCSYSAGLALSLTGKERKVYSPILNRRETLTKPVELPQGTLEMLILKAVSLGPLHGYGILLRIQQISGERLEILQGSFYTAIYRLERQGAIRGEWSISENNRRARFYSLTAAGARQLKAETAKWIDMAAVVAGILEKKAEEI